MGYIFNTMTIFEASALRWLDMLAICICIDVYCVSCSFFLLRVPISSYLHRDFFLIALSCPGIASQLRAVFVRGYVCASELAAMLCAKKI